MGEGLATRTMPSAAHNSLNIIQTNLQHKQIAAATLRRVLEVDNKTVALIQEPWIKNNRVCSLNNKNGKLLLDNTVDKPRTCIVVPKTITTVLLNQFCSRDLTAAKIITENQTVLVLASVYMPNEGEVPVQRN